MAGQVAPSLSTALSVRGVTPPASLVNVSSPAGKYRSTHIQEIPQTSQGYSGLNSGVVLILGWSQLQNIITLD